MFVAVRAIRTIVLTAWFAALNFKAGLVVVANTLTLCAAYAVIATRAAGVLHGIAPCCDDERTVAACVEKGFCYAVECAGHAADCGFSGPALSVAAECFVSPA